MPDLIKQEDMPTRKVSAIPIAGAAASILSWILYVAFGVEMPPGVEGAVATVAAFLLAYWVKEWE